MNHLGDSTLRDIDIESLVHHIGCSTLAGASEVTNRLKTPITDIPELIRRQEELQYIRGIFRQNSKEISTILLNLHMLEEDTLSVANASSDSRLKEYYNQILWSKDSFFSQLNHISILTEGMIFLRTLVLPAISLVLPILIVASPFILYSMMGKELSLSSYLEVLLRSIRKAVPSVLGAPKFQGKGGPFEMGEQFVHIGVSFIMLLINVWNQISSAIHMRNIVADMRRRASAARSFLEATQRLSILLDIPCPLQPFGDNTMGVFGAAWMKPDALLRAVQHAGYLDMLTSLAMQTKICFPTYSNTNTFYLQKVYHPGIRAEKRMYNTITLSDTKKKHVLLTGPNRGGKSTFLKSLGTAVLMSQTVGIVYARSAELPVFKTILTALHPADSIGKMSLFETEIEFAKTVRSHVADGCPIFLMMDEIFHGTNAHDGVEASQIFLDSLYSDSPDIYSVISTHYMDLPNTYGGKYSQNLCMDATIDPTNPDRLMYSYKLMEGINKYSSVREILMERGLITKKTTKASEKE
jgi:hypothetical protein